MAKYIIKRVLLMIPVILGVTILVFTIMYFVPGDAALTLAGSGATQEEIDYLRETLGLNQPYWIRLGKYLYQVFLKFDLGTSYTTGMSISAELAERIPRSLIVGLSSMVVALCVGIPLGIYAAVHQNKLGDRITMVIAILGVSTPTFWLALMMVVLFSVKLGWLPAYGIGGWKFWVMPILSGCFATLADMARQARSSMLEVIKSDYVIMARSKGLAERAVIYRHALPNALIPIITVTGMRLAMLLGGGMVIESIFSIPGVGYYMVKAVNLRDYPVVQGSLLVLSIFFSFVILATDVLMACVDPRIKAQFSGGKKKKKGAVAK